MGLRSTLGRVRRQALCSFHRRSVALGDCGPIVSFCFDDFPRSAYTVGGSILKRFGARGTFYLSMGLMNGWEEPSERVTVDDLRSLVEDGHELATHTFSHVSPRALPLAKFRQDVRKGQEAIRQIGLAPSANFAYPFGEVTLAAKGALAAELASCRSIYGGVNGALVDLNLLLANSLYGDTERVAAAERLILENQDRRRGWLIFYTHDVRTAPSSFGCTPRLLESAVSYSMQRGSRILTVAEVLAALQSKEIVN
jgi:peptidoglycan/xylan/chitin deacetylase (PgdA/CDA1 family)